MVNTRLGWVISVRTSSSIDGTKSSSMSAHIRSSTNWWPNSGCFEKWVWAACNDYTKQTNNQEWNQEWQGVVEVVDDTSTTTDFSRYPFNLRGRPLMIWGGGNLQNDFFPRESLPNNFFSSARPLEISFPWQALSIIFTGECLSNFFFFLESASPIFFPWRRASKIFFLNFLRPQIINGRPLRRNKWFPQREPSAD